MGKNNGKHFHSIFNFNLFLVRSVNKGKIYTKILLWQAHFFSTLKTLAIQNFVLIFTLIFYKMYSFLSYFLKIYFFKGLIILYLTTRSTVMCYF